MLVKSEPSQRDAVPAKMIFRFEVSLLSGPVAQSFVVTHSEPLVRIIDIRGSQTLDALHQAIFRAFDREDPHLYEFQLGGNEPMDRKAVRYGIPFYDDEPGGKDARTTSIATLNLTVGSSFFYWFDFGDDWRHKVRLLAVNPPEKSRRRYPHLVEKRGESPPQYIDWDAEESLE